MLAKQPDRVIERKGPSVPAALDANGEPTQALLGFARSCGVAPAKLERRRDEKGEFFVYQAKRKGERLARYLPGMVEAALKELPAPKLMRWGTGEAQFVRPVHGVILLHGAKVVPGTVLGVKAGNKTRGHRFIGRGELVIRRAAEYEKTLRARGRVIASFQERRGQIEQQLRRTAAARRAYVFPPGNGWDKLPGGGAALHQLQVAQGVLRGNAELLEEVTALVEWPKVYAGRFEREFLQLPPECISLTMQKNQKYFALTSHRAELLPDYLFVSNMEVARPEAILRGNARVLRARLADARFFFEQDKKTKLADRVPRLAHVVFHGRLGTQLERVQRLQKLALEIGRRMQAHAQANAPAHYAREPWLAAPLLERIERAALLCKADLVSGMVSEFPELQGIMGRYYALHDGEAQEVAEAIEQHYFPRASGGDLPQRPAAICVAAADKLDTLVGLFGIDLAPTGEKDPFSLRRASLGLVRLLIEHRLPLNFKELVERARALHTQTPLAPNVVQQVVDFCYDRLRSYLKEKGHAPDEIEAVLALKPVRLDQVVPRLEALRQFRAAPEGQALAAANKRIQNILRQAAGDPDKITPAIDGALFREEAEKALARALGEVAARVAPLTAAGDYGAALKELARLRGPVDAFFDKVMVMVDDAALRNARLQLLARVRHEFREIADVSKLQG